MIEMTPMCDCRHVSDDEMENNWMLYKTLAYEEYIPEMNSWAKEQSISEYNRTTIVQAFPKHIYEYCELCAYGSKEYHPITCVDYFRYIMDDFVSDLKGLVKAKCALTSV